MSEQDLKSISNATGTFTALQPEAVKASLPGKSAPASGNNAPVTAVDEPNLKTLAATLNLQSLPSARDLRFKVDMNGGHAVIQVVDHETGELIREIPPEKAEISLSVNGEVQIRLYNGQA